MLLHGPQDYHVNVCTIFWPVHALWFKGPYVGNSLRFYPVFPLWMALIASFYPKLHGSLPLVQTQKWSNWTIGSTLWIPLYFPGRKSYPDSHQYYFRVRVSPQLCQHWVFPYFAESSTFLKIKTCYSSLKWAFLEVSL